MKVLVTGSVSTVGEPLCRELARRGHEVFGVDLMHQPQANFRRADVANYREMQEVLKEFRPDMVYHLAAEFGRWNGEHYYERLWMANAVGMKVMLHLQKEMGYRMIFASSSEVYGESEFESIPEEMLKLVPVRYFNDYAMAKMVNEWQIMNAIERDGVETMILRFFNAYGPGEYYHKYRSVVCLFCYSALHDMPITVYAKDKRGFMYVDDLISTLARACEKFKSGEVYNLGTEEFVTVQHLVDVIRRSVPTYSEKLITWKTSEDMNVRNKRPHVVKARRDLEHSPKTTIEEGVPRTLDWMREVYRIAGK